MLLKFGAKEANLPKIYSSDPALIGMSVNPGDMILIKRQDHTSNYDYFRIVIKG